jgi:transposase
MYCPLFLPEGLLDYFDITEASDMGSYYMLCLLEKNIVPEEYADLPLVSKGFHEPVTITDFPVRDRTVYLRVTRRRWKDKVTGKSYKP